MMSEQPIPEQNEKLSSANMLRNMYSLGVDQIWVETHGDEPDRKSEEYRTFATRKLSPIDFQNRQNWQRNADLELSLSQAANRRLQSLLEKK